MKRRAFAWRIPNFVLRFIHFKVRFRGPCPTIIRILHLLIPTATALNPSSCLPSAIFKVMV
jgi:hypothetical protein